MTKTHAANHPTADGTFVADLSDLPEFRNIPPEGEYFKLSQVVYDTAVSLHKNSPNEYLEITIGFDTSDIKLDESIKHDFKGRNVVYQVPPGSILGDRSIIHSDAIIDNCTIGFDVDAGDNVVISNSHIGGDFEAGEGLSLFECNIEQRFTAIQIERMEGCSAGPMFSAMSIDRLGNQNTLSPWFMLDSIGQIGNNNQFLGDDPLPEGISKVGTSNKRINVSANDVSMFFEPANLRSKAKIAAQKNGFEVIEHSEKPKYDLSSKHDVRHDLKMG